MESNGEDEFGFNEDNDLQRLLDLIKNAKEKLEKGKGIQPGEIDGSVEFESFLSSLTDNTEPDKIEKFERDGLDFVIKYWSLPEGDFKTVDILSNSEEIDEEKIQEKIAEILEENGDMKVVSVDINSEPVTKSSLESQEAEAVKNEDYERAIVLRDLIKERDLVMEPKISELNKALDAGDLDLSESLLAELKIIKNKYN